METKRIIGKILLLLIVASIVSVPQAYAKSEYLQPLIDTYGKGTCLDCHTGPNGGKSLTAYGSSFKAQSGYKSNPVAAIQAIGKPPGGVPEVTDTVIAAPNDTTTNIVTETPSETTTPLVTQTTVAPQTTVKADTTKKVEAEEKEEENEEKEETKESPGLGIISVIGIVSIVYILRRFKL